MFDRPLMRFANALTADQAKNTSQEALTQAAKDPNAVSRKDL